MKKLSTVLVFALSLLIIACGDDKKGDEDQSAGLKISGVVVDPYIKDSRVSLIKIGETVTSRVCGSNGNLPCEGWSDVNGVWQISINEGMNLDDYYLKAIGGIDTKYGIAFDSIPLRRSEFALNDNIVISPITTVLHDYSSTANDSTVAENSVNKALGFTEGTDLYADPMDNISLLKESYMIVKTAILLNEKGGNDSVNIIATNIGSNENIFSNDIYLEAILDGADNTTSRAEIKASKASLDATTGAIDEVISSIAKTEKLVYFTQAIVNGLQNYPVTPAVPTADFTANIEQLYDRVEIVMESDLSVIQTNINQIVRLLKATQEADELDDYVNFNVAESVFKEQLVTYVPETLKARLVGVSTDSVISVDIPYFEVLGDNNSKRSNYYFNSTADNTYKARQLISNVNSDAINDTIYAHVIIANAKYGLHEKAANFANIYIINSLKRADAHVLIGRHSLNSDKVKAIEHLDESKRLLDAIYNTVPTPSGNALTSISLSYQELEKYYNISGEIEKGTAVRNFLINDILGNLSDPKYANTLRMRLVSAMGNASGKGSLFDLIADKNYELAEEMALEFEGHIKEFLPGSRPGFLYTTHVLYYEVLVSVYYNIVQQKKSDGASDTDVAKYKTIIGDIFLEADTLKDIDAANGGTVWEGYYGKMAEAVAWAKGVEYVETEIIAGMTIQLDKASAYGNYLKLLAKEKGFNEAKSYYETNVPIGDNFSMLPSYVRTFLSFNVHVDEALAYIVQQLENAVTYFTSQTPQPLKLIELITVNSNIISQRYQQEGYLKVAERYRVLNKIDESKAVLVKATAYVDKTEDSFLKSKAYAAIGKLYLDLGDKEDAGTVFDKAATVTLSAGSKKIEADFYFGLAHDEFTMNNTDKTAKMNEYLKKATDAVDLMPKGTDNDKKSRVASLNFIAIEYANIPDLTKADAVLQLATTDAQTINSTSQKKSNLIAVMDRYVSIGLVDKAGSMANDKDIMTTEADKYSALESIAEAVVLIDAFRGTDIAISDIDKDGKPDFFAPWATAEQITASGLTLDDDIDGDSVLDSEDLRPFFKDN